MSASGCSATSTSTCERSPACSCAWKPLRPVRLIRSPMVQHGDSRLRECVRRELDAELEARLLRIRRPLDALDHCGGHRDPGHLRVDVAKRGRRAHEADRRQERGLAREPARDGFREKTVEELRLEADLELEEARAGADLLERAIDAVLERRCARILDRAEEEVRRRVERAPGEVAADCHRLRGRQQLQAVEVEHAARLGLVAGGHVVAGEAAEVLDPV